MKWSSLPKLALVLLPIEGVCKLDHFIYYKLMVTSIKWSSFEKTKLYFVIIPGVVYVTPFEKMFATICSPSL